MYITNSRAILKDPILQISILLIFQDLLFNTTENNITKKAWIE